MNNKYEYRVHGGLESKRFGAALVSSESLNSGILAEVFFQNKMTPILIDEYIAAPYFVYIFSSPLIKEVDYAEKPYCMIPYYEVDYKSGGLIETVDYSSPSAFSPLISGVISSDG